MTGPEAIRSAVEACQAHLSFLVRSGSKAYGIAVESSDDDYVGIFVPRLRDLVSIHGIRQDTITGNGPDFTIHEIGKFSHLALKGNPAILEALWNPDVLEADAWGRALIGMRRQFLHRGSLKVYVAYAESQLRKMGKGKGLHSKGGTYNGKYGAHLIRLLHAGLGLAATGEVMVRVPPPLAETLMEIRTDRLPESRVIEMARPLLEELKRRSDRNDLPENPAFDEVNDLVVKARLSRDVP